jgi:hypothetical protein
MKSTVVMVALACVLGGIAYADNIIVDNTEYKNYQVMRTEPDGIVVKHDSGIAKLYFWELPTDLQKKYNYDPEKAAAFNKQAKELDATWQAKLKSDAIAHQKTIDAANAQQAADMAVHPNLSGISTAASPSDVSHEQSAAGDQPQPYSVTGSPILRARYLGKIEGPAPTP